MMHRSWLQKASLTRRRPWASPGFPHPARPVTKRRGSRARRGTAAAGAAPRGAEGRHPRGAMRGPSSSRSRPRGIPPGADRVDHDASRNPPFEYSRSRDARRGAPRQGARSGGQVRRESVGSGIREASRSLGRRLTRPPPRTDTFAWSPRGHIHDVFPYVARVLGAVKMAWTVFLPYIGDPAPGLVSSPGAETAAW